MYWFINCLLQFYDFIFGCHHRTLSRVFTIQGDTYVVCCLCGDKFPYSLDSMSIYCHRSNRSKPPAHGFLALGLNSPVGLTSSSVRATVK